MSDSYYMEDIGDNPWFKLYIYIRFRVLSEGLWIGTSPSFWFDVIMDDETVIKEVVEGDSGARIDHYTISVYKGHNPDKILYGTKLACTNIDSAGGTFVKRAKEVYKYMKTYSDISGWLDNARDFDKQCSDDEGYTLNANDWNKIFGPFDNTGTVDLKSFDFSTVDPLLPKIFGLLASMHDYSDLIQEISFPDDVHERMDIAKEWALFVLLEMVRYYCTAT